MKELSNFHEQVERANGYVLLDFSATWCGPCKHMLPHLESLSGEMHEVAFYKVDVDSDQDLAVKYQIRAVPTLMLFKDGEILDRKSGAMDEDSLRNWIEDNIKD